MIVARIRGCFGGDGITPYAIGDNIGQKAIKFLVGPAMETGNARTTQYASVLLKEIRRDRVKESAIEHGIDNACGRAVHVIADDPGDNDVRVHDVDSLRHRPTAPDTAVKQVPLAR